jgi:hypothetical protein
METTDYNKAEEIARIRKEYEVVKHKYPHHIPVVVKCKGRLLKLKKTKFLISEDTTIGQVMFILRKKLEDVENKSSIALFLIVNNTLLPSNQLLIEAYQNNKDEATGMLFITLCQESTFGCF